MPSKIPAEAEVMAKLQAVSLFLAIQDFDI